MHFVSSHFSYSIIAEQGFAVQRQQKRSLSLLVWSVDVRRKKVRG